MTAGLQGLQQVLAELGWIEEIGCMASIQPRRSRPAAAATQPAALQPTPCRRCLLCHREVSRPCKIFRPATLATGSQIGDRFTQLRDELEQSIEDTIRAERFSGLPGTGAPRLGEVRTAYAAAQLTAPPLNRFLPDLPPVRLPPHLATVLCWHPAPRPAQGLSTRRGAEARARPRDGEAGRNPAHPCHWKSTAVRATQATAPAAAQHLQRWRTPRQLLQPRWQPERPLLMSPPRQRQLPQQQRQRCMQSQQQRPMQSQRQQARRRQGQTPSLVAAAPLQQQPGCSLKNS